MSAPRFALRAIELYERPVVLRLPFRFGMVTLERAPQAFVRARVRLADGAEAWGASAEMMVPKWFEKDPARSNDADVEALRASLRNARADRLQTSLNLALGSALASIGLTIPTVAAVSILLGQPVVLGLEPKEIVLLALTLIVGVITLGTGRTTLLQGVVHLAIFAAFLFFAVVP